MSSSANVSEPARDLIRWMLAAKPADRPTMEQIIGHSFFSGYTPDTLPRSSLTKVPSFPEGAVSAASVASRAIRRPLGAVDVNSPAATGGSKKASKPSSRKAMPEAPSKTYKSHPASSERDHSLPAVLAKLQNLVADQKTAAPSGLPTPVSESVAVTSTWISKWVDYSNKYGLGYQLSDGSVGVLFNDSTKMVLSADQQKIESIERSAAGHVVTHLTLTDFPAGLTKKVTLLKYFQSYMNKNLLNGGNGSPTPAEQKQKDDMMHVKKWIRTSQAIVFRLSQGVIQINFFDHAKLIFNAPLGLVTFIDKSRETNTYTLADISKTNSTDETIADLVERLPYAVEVVNKMIGPAAHR